MVMMALLRKLIRLAAVFVAEQLDKLHSSCNHHESQVSDIDNCDPTPLLSLINLKIIRKGQPKPV